MFTVALIGPDGVGKTTVAKLLETSFQLPVKYIYMGFSAEASNYMLPTTRWWEQRKRKQKKTRFKGKPAQSLDQTANPSRAPRPLTKGFVRGAIRIAVFMRKTSAALIKGLGFINRIFEEWYRQLIAFAYKKRGYVVVFDRHFIYDCYHRDIEGSRDDFSPKRRLHGLFLKHTLSEPDLVIYMDAPGEVVFRRKGEFTPEVLETKRSQYLSLKKVAKNFAVVDANRNLDLVVRDVGSLIHRYSQTRRNGP